MFSKMAAMSDSQLESEKGQLTLLNIPTMSFWTTSLGFQVRDNSFGGRKCKSLILAGVIS